MATLHHILLQFQALPYAVPTALAALSWLFFLYHYCRVLYSTNKKTKNTFGSLPPVPVVHGLPVIVNLLQLKEKKPYQTLTSWAEEFGPIYSIRTGAATMVVLSNSEVAKEIAINIFGCNMDNNQREGPEEWKPDPSDMYKTMAFGAGKRVCAGALQAVLIACPMIGKLVQEFEWKLRAGEEENVETVVLTDAIQFTQSLSL